MNKQTLFALLMLLAGLQTITQATPDIDMAAYSNEMQDEDEDTDIDLLKEADDNISDDADDSDMSDDTGDSSAS